MSQLNVDTIKKADGTGNLSVPAETGTVVTTASPSLGRRRLTINGDMRIAQRGTSAVSANASYPVDRFILGVTTASKFTAQQSSVAPVGFSNSLLLTSSSAYTPASGDSLIFATRLEGYDVSQLESGTANAQVMTLSFYVRSSLTGTFAGFFANGDYNRTYPFTYTISSADTWERKTITLTADTTGTWGSTNGRGISIHWSLGIGSTLQGTANAWQAGNYQGVSGAVDLVATNGATLYITGVQLEVGSVSTPFEHRSYGEELALCQRYYQYAGGGVGRITSSSAAEIAQKLSPPMRATPTAALVDGTNAILEPGVAYRSITGISVTGSFNNENAVQLAPSGFSGNTGNVVLIVGKESISFEAEL